MRSTQYEGLVTEVEETTFKIRLNTRKCAVGNSPPWQRCAEPFSLHT